MRIALEEAQAARDMDEVPVGALVVSRNGMILGRGHNMVEHLKDSTAHAEIIAITAACNRLGSKFLTGCTLYVTLEPCLMCLGAIVLARISQLVYGCDCSYTDPARKTLHNHTVLYATQRLNLVRGTLADSCSSIVKNYFVGKRNKGF